MALKTENSLLIAQVTASLNAITEVMGDAGTQLIALRRYEGNGADIDPAFGIHVVFPGNLLEVDADWQHYTVGLYDPTAMKVLWQLCGERFGDVAATTTYADQSEDLQAYVRRQIIPLEWKGWDDTMLTSMMTFTRFAGGAA